ncbi:MAG: redoxin family protein [Actinobacteria bacterium]|nr:redoxin family protein [Actinomycetota bacterium]
MSDTETRKRSAPRPTLIAAVVVGCVVALLVVLLATRDNAADSASTASLEGKRAPAIGGDLVLGEPFDLGASDRWVVVNFFATWCTPCRVEHPELKAFADEHEKLGDARVVSVVYDEDPDLVKKFFEENGGDWSVFDSDQGRTAFEWGVTGVPESYLVSGSGIVVEKIVGGVTKAELDAMIAAYSGAAVDAGAGSGP